MLRTTMVSFVCAGTVLLAFAAPPVMARHAATHAFSSSFKSPLGIPAGERGLDGIAVDEETGYVYLENVASGIPLEKYSATGTPVAFTAPEANSSNTLLTPGGGGFRAGTVEVDNSGNPATKGRIYTIAESGINAFEPSGERVGGNFPLELDGRDLAIEPGTGNLWILFFGGRVTEYSPEGVLLGKFFEGPGESARIAMDEHGNFYLAGYFTVYRYNLPSEHLETFGNGTDVAVDPTTDDIYTYWGGTKAMQYGVGGALLFEFGVPPESTNGIPTIGVNGATGVVYRGIGGTIELYAPGPSVTLPDATTDPPTNFAATSATVHGTINPDGEPTEQCYFEWGSTTAYSHKTSCEEGSVLSGSTPESVSLSLSGLQKGTTYHYRVVAVNPNGTISGLDRSFSPSSPPTFSDEHVGDVHSDSVVLHGAIDPEGAATSYQFEYGLEDCASSTCNALPVSHLPLGLAPLQNSIKVTGLEAGTTYHYRVVAENQSGSAVGGDHTFTTFPITAILEDPCPNAHVRQQTSGALLMNCRAYELVSAGNAGGYDVESTLVPGQEPFVGYPEVGPESRVLYAVHDGAIPGSGNPANHGRDTYIASRGPDGWSTKYVGIPSDNPYSNGSFASILLEADSKLTTFAFGGEGICSPCFGDGSTNIPLRLPDGSLVEGMAGSQSPGVTNPAGHVGRYLSADGEHLVFGTTAKLEATGNENGDVTIYERGLAEGTTEVVSTLPEGETMSGSGIGELDVSSSGSRVIVGRKISTDSAGNEYWHLYLHMAGSSHSVDLTPGAGSGALYAGMTDDGSRIFFSTRDKLLSADTDTSADIYEAEVDNGGTMHLELVSVGESGPSNSDECNPPGEWNTVAGGPDCSAVAFAGGAGVASEAGTFYFLSPEALDLSNPENLSVDDQANLYVVKPGEPPHFVATLDSSTGKPPPKPPQHHLSTANFVAGLSAPEAMTIDQSTHDLYVNAIGGGGKVFRYETGGSTGAPKNFTAGPAPGTNTITGLSFEGGGTETQVAVDSSGGELAGDIYVANYGYPVKIFAPDGSSLGSISVPSACGVAVGGDGSVYARLL